MHVGGNRDGRPKKIKKRSTVNVEDGVLPVCGMKNKAANTIREISREGLINKSWKKSLGNTSRESRLITASTYRRALSMRNKLLA